MTNTITIDSDLYKGAFLYAEKHNVSIQEMVSQYLLAFKVENVKRNKGKKELPVGVKKLRGTLKNIADKDDERLNCILAKGRGKRYSLLLMS